MSEDLSPALEGSSAALTIDDAREDDGIAIAFPGGAPRHGRIIAVFHRGARSYFHVRWDDSAETMFYPDPRHTTITRDPRPSD